MPDSGGPLVRRLGRVDYAQTLLQMREFTSARDEAARDEIWLCEHPPVYTLGIAASTGHLLNPGVVPVIRTDRGGQVTYHGPGQVVAYPLINLRRLGIYVKEYVFRLEQALLRTLESVGVTGHRVAGAPGIYVRIDHPTSHAMLDRHRSGERPVHRAEPCFDGVAKIAALGVKVSRHCTYHGVALNVAMDLQPFGGINPCGHAGLATVDLSTIGVDVPVEDVTDILATKLGALLSA